jgi:hypothetical protein
MTTLLREIWTEAVLAAKEAPRIYFEPLVLMYRWLAR